MKTLKIENGDFVTGTENRWEYLTGTDAAIQRIRHRLRLFTGEWFLDTNEGIDWVIVLDKPFSIRRMKSEIIKTLVKEETISAIESIEIEPDFRARSLKINLTITVDSETVNISETMTD